MRSVSVIKQSLNKCDFEKLHVPALSPHTCKPESQERDNLIRFPVVWSLCLSLPVIAYLRLRSSDVFYCVNLRMWLALGIWNSKLVRVQRFDHVFQVKYFDSSLEDIFGVNYGAIVDCDMACQSPVRSSVLEAKSTEVVLPMLQAMQAQRTGRSFRMNSLKSSIISCSRLSHEHDCLSTHVWSPRIILDRLCMILTMMLTILLVVPPYFCEHRLVQPKALLHQLLSRQLAITTPSHLLPPDEALQAFLRWAPCLRFVWRIMLQSEGHQRCSVWVGVTTPVMVGSLPHNRACLNCCRSSSGARTVLHRQGSLWPHQVTVVA